MPPGMNHVRPLNADGQSSMRTVDRITTRLASSLLAALFVLGPLSDARAADFSYGQRLYSIGDYGGAIRIWRELAEEGDARAQYSLALMHAQGMGVTRDYGKARAWAQMAAAQDFAPARALLTVLGDDGTPSARGTDSGSPVVAAATQFNGDEEARIKRLAEDVLQQFAGSSARFGDLRYGDVHVDRNAGGFTVSIMDVALHGNVEVIDIGTIKFFIAPQDSRHDLVRMALPTVLYVRPEDGPLVRVTIGQQQSRIVWDRRLATSTVFSIAYGDLQLKADGEPGHATIGQISASANLQPEGDRWSGPVEFQFTDMSVYGDGPDPIARIGRLGFATTLDGFDLEQYLRAMQGLRPGQERPGELGTDFVALLRQFRMSVTMADIMVKPTETDAGDFSLTRADLSLTYADEGEDLAKLRLDLELSESVAHSSRTPRELMPEALTLNLRLDRLPVSALTQALVVMGVDVALFGEVTQAEELQAGLMQELISSGTSLHLERAEIAGRSLQVQAHGLLRSDSQAAMGAVGSLVVNIVGLEALLGSPVATENAEIEQVANMLFAMSRSDPAGSGRRIEMTLDGSGQVLVNGEPMQIGAKAE